VTCPLGKDALAGGPNCGFVDLGTSDEEKNVKRVAGARIRTAARLRLRERVNLLRDLPGIARHGTERGDSRPSSASAIGGTESVSHERCRREVDVEGRPRPAEVHYPDFQGDRAIFQRARLAAPDVGESHQVRRRARNQRVARVRLGASISRYRDRESRRSDCLLREVRKIVDIAREIVALVFGGPIRSERSTVVLVEPIHLLAKPNQLFGSHPQTPKQTDRIWASRVSVLIGGFGFRMAMVRLDVLVQPNHRRSVRVAAMPI